MATIDRKVWFSARAMRLHAVIIVVVPAFMALCVWQIHRALAGNSLSWAYVFEWPLFAGYAVYMWWRFLHEDAPEAPSPDTARPPDSETGATGSSGAMQLADTATGSARRPADRNDIEEDPELVAYNAYLAQLAGQDQARPKRRDR